jgi:hypothetical protein
LLPLTWSAIVAMIWSALFAALEKMLLVMVHLLLLMGWSPLTPARFGVVGSCCWGWSPGNMTRGGTLVLRSPPCAGFVVLTRWSGAFYFSLVRGGSYCWRSLFVSTG